jgi:hypothetical protein
MTCHISHFPIHSSSHTHTHTHTHTPLGNLANGWCPVECGTRITGGTGKFSGVQGAVFTLFSNQVNINITQQGQPLTANGQETLEAVLFFP